MDSLGKEFLAGAAFAGDEDGRRIGLSDFGCQMFQQFHLRRSADDVIECRESLFPRVMFWRLEGMSVVDGSLEILHRDRLRKIVGGAMVQRFNRGFCRSVCSEDDDGEIVSSASGLRQDHLTCNPSVALVTNDECEVCYGLSGYADFLRLCAAARMVARRWLRACSSNGLARGSVEMSSKIGGCIGASFSC